MTVPIPASEEGSGPAVADPATRAGLSLPADDAVGELQSTLLARWAETGS